MAAVPRSESRHLYSWWWDSHNTPKNSKWLQENLADIDDKVKAMIKLIEEDADSFARRAEMYYKKRPELMKQVEEFYRAYRALAERYNHATGELRHAHRTLAKAFPDQVPPELSQDSPPLKPLALGQEPHSPEMKSLLIDGCDLLPVDESSPFGAESVDSQRHRYSDGRFATRRALKYDLSVDQLSSTSESKNFEDEMNLLSTENQNLKNKVVEESERAGKAEVEVESLKRALVALEAEMENVLLQHQMCLSKLSLVELEYSNMQKDSMRFSEKASQAEIEVQTLKEALFHLEAEKNAGLVKHKEYIDKISILEDKLARAGEVRQSLVSREKEGEREAQSLKEEISRLKIEKDAALHRYTEFQGKASTLQGIINATENEAALLKKQAEKAEAEVCELKKLIADLMKRKEASAIQYQGCMERMSELEHDLLSAKEEVKRLNNEIMIGNLKLKNAEDKYNLLKISNQSLKNEAENLVKKIAVKDQELFEKQHELESIQSCLQDEHLRRGKIESTLDTLRKLHSQSQEDQKALAAELKNMLQALADLEINKQGLEEAFRVAQDENETLCQANLSSAASMEKLQREILTLSEIKFNLEKEVCLHTSKGKSFEKEISLLKEEIRELNESYQDLVGQVETVGLTPGFLVSAVSSLRDENLCLSQNNDQINEEKRILLKEIEQLVEKNVTIENSMNANLWRSEGKMNALEESCQSLRVENAELVAEKASLLSQLNVVTESMHRLLEKNAVSENSLAAARTELEVLREKSKGLEEICELLKKERSYLLNERDSLSLKLQTVERKVESLEKRCMVLQEKYACLEKEKEAIHIQAQKLEVSLSAEKQERKNSKIQSEMRMIGLEKQIHLLEEDNRWQRQEYQDELEKSLKAQLEFSALQKFVKDVEEKNCSLISECQKHVGASLLAEKLISELETESLQQQVEAELLLDEIERLRFDIYEIFKALDDGPDFASHEQIDNDKTLVTHILGIIEDMKCSLLKHEEDKQLSLVENSVLLALIEQMESKGIDLELQKKLMEKELISLGNKICMLEKEKQKLLELTNRLKSEVSESHWRAALLEAETDSLRIKHDELFKGHRELEEQNSQLIQENSNLLEKFSDMENRNFMADQYIDEALLEHLTTVNQSTIFRSFASDKTREMGLILQDLENERKINCDLKMNIDILAEELSSQKAETLHLRDTVKKLDGEIQRMMEYNVQMKKDVQKGEERFLQEKHKLVGAEMKLEAAEMLNSQLCQTVDELNLNVQESLHVRENLEKNIHHLSEDISRFKEKIEGLHTAKEELESELGRLHEEINQKTCREQSLILELQDKNSKLQILEVEVTAFYFEFQTSSIRDILYENKVRELTGVCNDLLQENSSKTSEIEQMKCSLRLLEGKVIELKSQQLAAHSPFVVSLRDDVRSPLEENNAFHQSKLKPYYNQEPEILEGACGAGSSISEMLEEEPLLGMQNMNTRTKSVGKMVEEVHKSVSVSRKSCYVGKQEHLSNEIEHLKHRRFLGRGKQEHSRRKELGGSDHLDSPKLHRIKTKPSALREGMRMKDIPLDHVSEGKRIHHRADDQMLELWETADDSRKEVTIGESLRMPYRMSERDIDYCLFEDSKINHEPPSTDSDLEKELSLDKMLSTRIVEPTREMNTRRILERLALDAKRLENLQITVDHLRMKLGTCKKSKSSRNVDFDTVQEQLQEAEETIQKLLDLNVNLVKNIEGCPSPVDSVLSDAMTMHRRRVTEHARKGSERIGRLQLELQKIQYILLKMEEEKKNKARNKFFRSRSIILRDFIYNGKKNSGKRKKSLVCGCFRPSTSRSGRLG